jgi:hypothetical protein
MTDDNTLIWEDEAHADPPEAQAPVTRRDLLRLGLVGGASALVSGHVTQRVGDSRSADQVAEIEARLGAQAEAEMAEVREALQGRIRRLEQELVLYRTLERTGLDNLIVTLLDTWDAIWRGVRDLVIGLRDGVDAVDRILQQWDERLTRLRAATRFWGGLLGGLEERVEGLRQLLGSIARHTAPIGETIQSFFDRFLEVIPFGWGTGLRQGAEGVTGVISSLPLLLQQSRDQVLDPLTDEWVAEEEGLNGGLFRPLRTALLTPLRAHLAYLGTLADSWETKTADPLRRTLAERHDMQRRIAALQAAEPMTLGEEQDTAA